MVFYGSGNDYVLDIPHLSSIKSVYGCRVSIMLLVGRQMNCCFVLGCRALEKKTSGIRVFRQLKCYKGVKRLTPFPLVLDRYSSRSTDVDRLTSIPPRQRKNLDKAENKHSQADSTADTLARNLAG